MTLMGFLYNEHPLGVALGIAVFLLFACVGVAHVVNPDYFVKRSAVRKGGEMLAGWNRFQFRCSGVAFAGFSAYMLYLLLWDILSK